MRLSKIQFKNFRCFKSESIDISDYTSFVGPNNCGKSTVLRALNIFFGEGVKSGAVQLSDFSVGSEDQDLSIILEFDQVTGEAAEELAHYVRNERLSFEIAATRDDTGQVSSKCRGIRYGLPKLAPFFAGQKAGDRKPIYEAFIVEGMPLPKWQNFEQAEAAVRSYEQEFAADFVGIVSEENAYGATGPLPKLRRFLDWIYVPAVKDASAEASEQRNSAFSKLILFAVRAKVDFNEQINFIREEAANQLSKILQDTQGVIDEVGGEIDKEFRSLSTATVNIALQWDDTQSIVLREPSIRSIFKDGQVFDSPENFGHGIQRTYIMALLSVAAKVQSQVDGFKLILGVEEPELYQHPPQAKFLSTALSTLSEGNAQVLITTHSPYFVTGRTFESIRSLRKSGNVTKVYAWTIDEQRAYCATRKGNEAIGAAAALSGMDRSLQPAIAELFFASKVIFVEGAEDEAIIVSYLRHKGMYSEFLMAGGHIVPVGGKSKMPMLIALARGMRIDVYCVFDFDMDKIPKNRANTEIIRYAADAGIMIPDEIAHDMSSHLFFASKNNIQASIKESVQSWPVTLKEIADEWGWDIERMEKDPMMLDEALRRTLKITSEIQSLELLVSSLRSFWQEN